MRESSVAFRSSLHPVTLSPCHLVNGAYRLQSTTAESRLTLGSFPMLTNGQLASVTLGRLALNVAYRIIYPLQPFLALHLQVDLRTVSALVTVQVLASIVSPLGGTLADTRGERATMTGGLPVLRRGGVVRALDRLWRLSGRLRADRPGSGTVPAGRAGLLEQAHQL